MKNACALASRFLGAAAIGITALVTGGASAYALLATPHTSGWLATALNTGILSSSTASAAIAGGIAGSIGIGGGSAITAGIGAAITAGVNVGEDYEYTVDDLEKLLGSSFVSSEELHKNHGWMP